MGAQINNRKSNYFRLIYSIYILFTWIRNSKFNFRHKQSSTYISTMGLIPGGYAEFKVKATNDLT